MRSGPPAAIILDHVSEMLRRFLERCRGWVGVIDGKPIDRSFPAHRWRDWASDPDRARQTEFLDFTNNESLPSLRNLSCSDEKTNIAVVFAETYNRMSGHSLRDNNLVASIFESKDEIFTFICMESAWRDAMQPRLGEFYTPRPVVKLIVDRVAPNWAMSWTLRHGRPW
jgi:hypothetical protein